MSIQSPSQELVEQFVIAAHFNLARVTELYEQHPELLNSVWAKFDETALAAASHMGQRAIANYLLAIGAPLVICTAAMLGDAEVVTSFIHNDPSLASARGAHGIPLMFHAAMSGNTDVTKLLLEHGGGEGINSALHGAIMYGHTEMVKWLLAHGATDVNVLNYEGMTPLKVAIEKEYIDIAVVLREHGGIE